MTRCNFLQNDLHGESKNTNIDEVSYLGRFDGSEVQVGNLKLNDQELVSLLDEIVYSVNSDVPITAAMHRMGSQRMGRLGLAAKRIAAHLESGGSLSDAILLIKSPSAKLVAATASPIGNAGRPSGLGQSGLGQINADLLGLLASRIRARFDAARVSRLMWFYPLVLVGIAYAAVLFVVVPLVSEYRFHITDQPLGIHWPTWLVQATSWLSAFPWIPPVLFVVSVLIAYFIAKKRPMFGAPMRKSLFCHALADQLGQGAPESDAILTASTLSGYPVDGLSPTLGDPPIRELLSDVGGIGEVDGISEVSGGDDFGKESLRLRIASSAAQFRYLGNLYQFAARRHQRIWSIVIPQVATVFFGLVFMTGYVWFVLGPIYREVAHW